jgi:hypothetical protein
MAATLKPARKALKTRRTGKAAFRERALSKAAHRAHLMARCTSPSAAGATRRAVAGHQHLCF